MSRSPFAQKKAKIDAKAQMKAEEVKAMLEEDLRNKDIIKYSYFGNVKSFNRIKTQLDDIDTLLGNFDSISKARGVTIAEKKYLFDGDCMLVSKERLEAQAAEMYMGYRKIALDIHKQLKQLKEVYNFTEESLNDAYQIFVGNKEAPAPVTENK